MRKNSRKNDLANPICTCVRYNDINVIVLCTIYENWFLSQFRVNVNWALRSVSKKYCREKMKFSTHVFFIHNGITLIRLRFPNRLNRELTSTIMNSIPEKGDYRTMPTAKLTVVTFIYYYNILWKISYIKYISETYRHKKYK